MKKKWKAKISNANQTKKETSGAANRGQNQKPMGNSNGDSVLGNANSKTNSRSSMGGQRRSNKNARTEPSSNVNHGDRWSHVGSNVVKSKSLTRRINPFLEAKRKEKTKTFDRATVNTPDHNCKIGKERKSLRKKAKKMNTDKNKLITEEQEKTQTKDKGSILSKVISSRSANEGNCDNIDTNFKYGTTSNFKNIASENSNEKTQNLRPSPVTLNEKNRNPTEKLLLSSSVSLSEVKVSTQAAADQGTRSYVVSKASTF